MRPSSHLLRPLALAAMVWLPSCSTTPTKADAGGAGAVDAVRVAADASPAVPPAPTVRANDAADAAPSTPEPVAKGPEPAERGQPLPAEKPMRPGKGDKGDPMMAKGERPEKPERKSARSARPVAVDGAPTVRGALDPQIVSRVVGKANGAIRACYVKQLAAKPKLRGTVVVGLTLDGKGRVRSAALRRSTVRSRRVTDCVLLTMKRLKFPRSKRGRTVRVSYPFTFKPTGE